MKHDHWQQVGLLGYMVASFKFLFLDLLTFIGSSDPETSHSYAAVSLDCWGTSYVASFLTLFSFFPGLISQMILCTGDIIVVINLCFPVPKGILWMVLQCFLKPQLVEGDGHPSRVWFCQRFSSSEFPPVKRESFLSIGREIGLKRSFGAICWFPYYPCYWTVFV